MVQHGCILTTEHDDFVPARVLTETLSCESTSNIDANSQEILTAREIAAEEKEWPQGKTADGILDDNNKAVIETTRQYGLVKRHASLLDE